MAESSGSTANVMESDEPAVKISFRTVQQPPREICTNERFPAPVTIKLDGLKLSPMDGGTSFDRGNVWAQMCLASDVGQIAFGLYDPDILEADSLTVPLISDSDSNSDRSDDHFTMSFVGIKISRPGYYKLRADLIIAYKDRDGNSIGGLVPPEVMISTETREVHVSSFTLPRNGTHSCT